jgi:hypothetical protein
MAEKVVIKKMIDVSLFEIYEKARRTPKMAWSRPNSAISVAVAALFETAMGLGGSFVAIFFFRSVLML